MLMMWPVLYPYQYYGVQRAYEIRFGNGIQIAKVCFSLDIVMIGDTSKQFNSHGVQYKRKKIQSMSCFLPMIKVES